MSVIAEVLETKVLGRTLRELLGSKAAFISLSFLLYAWMYAPVLQLEARGDDLDFVFQNPVIRDGMSPLLFWTRGHTFTKAWPAFYTLIWITQRLFREPILADHLLSLFFHFLNGLLLMRICSRLGLRHAWLAGPLVWFHPAHLVTVAHVILLTKILSSFAFLLWLGEWLRGAEAPNRLGGYARRLAFLSLSLFSSGQSYLLWAVEWRRYLGQLGLLRSLGWAAPFLLISVYGGFLAAVGVKGVEQQITQIENVRAASFDSASMPVQVIVPERASPAPDASPEPSGPAPESPAVIPSVEALHSFASPEEEARNPNYRAWDYLIGTFGFDSSIYSTPWFSKIRNVGVTGAYYVQMFFLPLRIMESVEIGQVSGILQGLLFLAGLGILGATGFFLYRAEYFWECILLTYISVSGIFYIPFMGHIDLVSARYSYLPFLPAIILVLRCFSGRPKAAALLFLWVAGLVLLAALESRTPGVYRWVNPT